MLMMASKPYEWPWWTEELRHVLDEILGEEEGHDDHKGNVSEDGRVSAEEKDKLERAVQLEGTNPSLRFAYIRALVDELNGYEDITDKRFLAVSFGTKRIFGSVGHLRDYIYGQCMKLFDLDPISLEYNLGIARLCTLTIPLWARNVQFAKLCLDRAVIFHHESYKALKRMAFYLLNVEKDIAAARSYFQKAISYDPEDFHTTTSILYSLFADIETFKGQINTLLKAEFQKPFWTDNQKAELYFIRGLFQFCYEGYEKSVAISWTLAFSKSEEEFQGCLERFTKTKMTYQFNWKYDDVFTFPNFCDCLKEGFAFPEVDAKKLKAIRALIKIVGRKELKEKNEKAARAAANYTSFDVRSHHYNKRDSEMGTTNLDNILLGSEGNVTDAFKLFGIPETSPKFLMEDKYRKACRELECIKKQPQCDHEEMAHKTFGLNSAFATLNHHFNRKRQDAAATAKEIRKSKEEIMVDELV